MNPCDDCGAFVDRRWKFCLDCGHRMMTAEHRASKPAPQSVRFDWQLTLGVVLALAGIALIVFLVVVLVIPHA